MPQAGRRRARSRASPLRQYLGELKRVFDWGEVYPNPCRWPHLRLPRTAPGQGQPDPPSLSEFWRLLGALPVGYRDPLIVAEATGVRISELRRLDLVDLDRRHARLRIARSKTDAGVRFVPLLPSVSRAIERHRGERRAGPIFAGLSDNGFRLAIARSAERARLRHFKPHDMRDRFIS